MAPLTLGRVSPCDWTAAQRKKKTTLLRYLARNKKTGSETVVDPRLPLPLLELEQRLRLDHSHLVRVCGKCMNMKLASPSLEIHVAERFEPTHL